MRYATYKVPTPAGRFVEVMVGSRPAFANGCEAVDKEGTVIRPDAWISVTDTQVAFPLGAVYHWLPWVEEAPPTKETLYAVLRLLNYYVRSGAMKIYVHCDAGTHRSPTIFGAYLLAYLGRRKAEEIQKTATLHGRTTSSEPLYYIDTYLTRNQISLAFLEWVAKNPEKRLEDYRATLSD